MTEELTADARSLVSVGVLALAAVAGLITLAGTSFKVLAGAALIVATSLASQVDQRSVKGHPFRGLWIGLLIVDVGVVYAVLSQSGLAVLVIYPLALALTAGGWWLDDRIQAQGWVRMLGLVLGTIVLLGGKGWSGHIPWQGLAFTLTTVLLFALFALGLNLEFGFGGLINFGHVAFMALGAYTVGILTTLGGFWATQVGIFVAFLLALAVAAVAGLLLALPAIRLREDYLAIVTIAAAEILRRILLNEQKLTQGAKGITLNAVDRPLHTTWLEGVPAVGPLLADGLDWLAAAMSFTGSPYLFILFLLGLGLTIGLLVMAERLVESPWGRVVEAIREDEDAARSLGINPTVYKLQVFALGSSVAAAAGALWIWQLTFIVPQQFAPIRTFWGWIMIVIGGVADNKGAIAGAFIFWTITNLTRGLSQLREYGLDSEQIAAFSPLALGMILIGFMLSKPEGLFGDKEELELVE